jgi:hypothetical protein
VSDREFGKLLQAKELPDASSEEAMSLVYILVDFENLQPTAADMSLIRGADYRVQLFHGPHQNKFDADMVRALQPLGSQLDYVQCERRGKNALDFHVAFCLGRLVQQHDSGPAARDQTRFVVVSRDSGFDALLGHVQKLGYGAARVGSIREALALDMATSAAGPGGPTLGSEQPLAVPAPPLMVVPAPAAESVAKAAVMRAPADATASPRKPTTAGPSATAKKGAEKTAAKKAAPSPKAIAKSDPWSKTVANLRDHPKNRPNTREALERHLATIFGNKATTEEVQALIARLEREGLAKETGGKIEYAI